MRDDGSMVMVVISRSSQTYALLLAALLVPGLSTADTLPPLVAITQPTNGSVVSGIVTVSASATADVGVADISFKLDGADFAAPVTSAPFNASLNTTTLANGMHTLLAVATDEAGNVARSTIISVNVTNPPRYKLGQGPFVIEDLGSPISGNVQQRLAMFRAGTNGDYHLLLYYHTTGLGTVAQIVDVNMTQGTARMTNMPSGVPGVHATTYYPANGKIYVANNAAKLFEYDPSTGSSNNSIALSGYGGNMQIGDDGFIYIGIGGGRVDRYNPTTGAYQAIGKLDPAATNIDQYTYSLGADIRYLYVGLGQSPWYLGVYDTHTGTSTNYWKAESDTYGAVYRGTSGGWYYRRGTVTSGTLWYSLSNGIPAIVSPAPSVVSWNYRRGEVVDDVAYFPQEFGYEVNLDFVDPDTSKNFAIIGWRRVGETTWQQASVTNFILAPFEIKRLYPWDAETLFGFCPGYGPAFFYDLRTMKATSVGRSAVSQYDAAFSGTTIYLSGYTSATLSYDFTNPWTLTASTTNKYAAGLNPQQLSFNYGKYHYYSALGSDGMLYVAGHHFRDSTGGELGWYDPVYGTNGSLRTPFLDFGLKDLKPALGGTKMVCTSETPDLYVIDVATKTIERTIGGILGTSQLDKLIEAEPGMVFGASNSNIFKVNIADGAVGYVKALPGKAFGTTVASVDRRLLRGPDGFVWMFIGNSLYRINPSDGAMSLILNTPAKTILFKDGDLFLYGGPNLYRIQNVLAPIVPPASALRVLPPP